MEQHIALALRKERLLIQAAAQREILSEWGGRLRKPCALADKAMDAGRIMRAHPLATGVALGVVALVGRRRLFGVAMMAWRGWRTWRLVQDVGLRYIEKHFKNK